MTKKDWEEVFLIVRQIVENSETKESALEKLDKLIQEKKCK